MGRELRVVIYPTVAKSEVRQLERWAGKRPMGHVVGMLIRHARKTGFKVSNYR
jgi:hypothetical protein